MADLATQDYPSRRSAYFIALILFCSTAFSYLDNQVLTLLVGPIERDLGISDTAVSALYGFAPVLIFALIGVPIGWVIDRKQRRLILAGVITLWSVMTVACGFATGYWTLFAARVGVGIGPAFLSPLAFSLLADCFEPRMRTRALNFYLLGVFAGTGLSLGVGGVLVNYLEHSAPLPLIGALASWRQVFVLVGAPGLIMAILALSMPEPARQEVVGAPTADGKAGAVSLFGYIRANSGTFAAVFVAETLLAATAYALMFAAPTYFIRVFDVPTIIVGRNLGILLSACGTVGALSGSILADRWATRGVKAAKFKVCALGMALAAPGLAALPFAPTPAIGFACVGLCLVFLPFGSVASFAMVQELFPNQLRGQGAAVALLLQAIAGTGGGPIAVGLASDLLFHGPRGFGFAIAAVGLPAIATFLVIFILGRNSYEKTRGRLGHVMVPA